MSSELKWYGPEVIKKMAEATEAGLTACAMQVHGQAVALAKGIVDTTRLNTSITYKTEHYMVGKGLETEVKEGEAIIGTNVEYAQYVELGTVPHWLYAGPGGILEGWAKRHNIKAEWIRVSGRPRPFLRPALDAVKGTLNAIFTAQYNRIMGKEK